MIDCKTCFLKDSCVIEIDGCGFWSLALGEKRHESEHVHMIFNLSKGEPLARSYWIGLISRKSKTDLPHINRAIQLCTHVQMIGGSMGDQIQIVKRLVPHAQSVIFDPVESIPAHLNELGTIIHSRLRCLKFSISDRLELKGQGQKQERNWNTGSWATLESLFKSLDTCDVIECKLHVARRDLLDLGKLYMSYLEASVLHHEARTKSKILDMIQIESALNASVCNLVRDYCLTTRGQLINHAEWNEVKAQVAKIDPDYFWQESRLMRGVPFYCQVAKTEMCCGRIQMWDRSTVICTIHACEWLGRECYEWKEMENESN